MKTMSLFSINDFRLVDIPKPKPKGDQILIKVGACGICGSDIPRVYQLGTKVYPVVLGHEFAGEVVEVGNPKDEDLIGKRCAVFPLIPCGRCDACETGNYCQCQNNGYLGSRNDGGFAEYCLIPSRWHLVFTKENTLDFENLCITEPACVAQHALRRGGVNAGQTIVITGAGPIGLLCARWAKIFGAKDVYLTEINDEKQRFAQKHGFHVINTMSDNVESIIKEKTNGRGADVVIEGTGSSTGINDAIRIARCSGTIVLMGNPHIDAVLGMQNYSLILRKELNIHGTWNDYYANLPLNEWTYTVEMIESGQLKVADLITHKAGIDDLKQLFEQIYKKKITACKAIYSASLNRN